MDRLPYRPIERQWPSEHHPVALALTAALLIGAGILAAVLFRPFDWERSAARAPSEVSELVFPASRVLELPQPAGGEWLTPAAAVTAGGATYVVDAGNDRILKLDGSGSVEAVFDSSSGAALDDPMAITTDGERLFVASSQASEVVVLDLSGAVLKVIRLEPQAVGEQPPRPIGVALLPDGTLAVSDAANHVVVFLDGEGNVLRTAGTGARAASRDGFNVPAALAADAAGNVYVVDTLNGRVVKLSAGGAFLGEFGRRGGTAGTLSRPKGVAVDAAGRVYVSDGLQAAVEVFAPDGTYLGLIGRSDPQDITSGPLFQAPAGLWLDGDSLYVIDRFAGLVTFSLSGGD